MGMGFPVAKTNKHAHQPNIRLSSPPVNRVAVCCMFQDNQRSSLKTLSTGVSAMQEQEEIDRGHLSVLQAQVLNFTVQSTQVSTSPFSTSFLLLLR
jgi:hypothetical protein